MLEVRKHQLIKLLLSCSSPKASVHNIPSTLCPTYIQYRQQSFKEGISREERGDLPGIRGLQTLSWTNFKHNLTEGFHSILPSEGRDAFCRTVLILFLIF